MPRAQFTGPQRVEHDEAIRLVEASAPPVRRSTMVVGHAADAAEVEADRVADEVIGRLQGADAPAHGPDCEHPAPDVARSAAPAAAAEVGYEGGAISEDLAGRIEAARGSGRSLDEPVRRRMEGAFGTSLAGVRIHTGAEAEDLNQAVAAKAFTTGNDIFFGKGEYDPGTPDGERTLAHELAHTQQQGGATRRIHRKWNIDADNLVHQLASANRVRVFEDRPILFFQDKSGDEIVVKAEDQPVGYGQLIGFMQTTLVDGVKNVKQRKFSKKERQGVETALDVAQAVGLDGSFTAYGQFLKASPKTKDLYGASTEDPAEIAWEHMVGQAKSPQTNLMAMEFAQGESAAKIAETDVENAEGSGKTSALMKMLQDPKHLRMLGQLTAVDMFMGNTDRMFNGNVGNWFYNPQGGITVIDNVDSGDQDGSGVGNTVAGLMQFDKWIGEPGSMLIDCEQLAEICIKKTIGGISDKYDDETRPLWNRYFPLGGKPSPEIMAERKAMVDGLLVGLREGRARLVKTMLSPGGMLSKSKKNNKAIQKAAAKATLDDSDDAAMGEKGPKSYFTMMKLRADYLQQNRSKWT